MLNREVIGAWLCSYCWATAIWNEVERVVSLGDAATRQLRIVGILSQSWRCAWSGRDVQQAASNVTEVLLEREEGKIVKELQTSNTFLHELIYANHPLELMVKKTRPWITIQVIDTTLAYPQHWLSKSSVWVLLGHWPAVIDPFFISISLNRVHL